MSKSLKAAREYYVNELAGAGFSDEWLNQLLRSVQLEAMEAALRRHEERNGFRNSAVDYRISGTMGEIDALLDSEGA